MLSVCLYTGQRLSESCPDTSTASLRMKQNGHRFERTAICDFVDSILTADYIYVMVAKVTSIGNLFVRYASITL